MGEEVALLDSWYQADTNHVPPVSVLQVGTVQYSTVQYSTVQYSTVQYSVHAAACGHQTQALPQQEGAGAAGTAQGGLVAGPVQAPR